MQTIFTEVSDTAKEKLGIGFIGAGEISILHAIALREIPNGELIDSESYTRKSTKRAQEEQCKRYDTLEELVQGSCD